MAAVKKGAQHMPFLAQDSPIRAWDNETLQQAKEDVEEMLASPGWRVLTELLEAGFRSIQGQLMYGGLRENTADYGRELGKLVGFEFAQAAAEAVVIKAGERDKTEAEMAGVVD